MEAKAENKNLNFLRSLEAHQIKVHHGASLVVTLTSSENEYLKYPVKGVLQIFEQGVNLRIIQAVFYTAKEDGHLGAPCIVKNPVFTNSL